MSAKSDVQRLAFLDGIRGWGALVVFMYHLVERFLAHADPRLVPTWSNFLFDGPFAVLVFFVVSGFALSYVNLDENRRDLTMAATARYFRLAIPVVITTFAGYCMLKAGLIINLEVSMQTGVSSDWLGRFFDFDPSLYSFVKFSFYNVFFAYYPDLSYNTNLWTISVEFLGSLVVYAYLSIFRREGARHWLVAVAMFAVFVKIAPYYACFMGGYLAAEASAKVKIAHSWSLVVELCALMVFYCVVLTITFHRPDTDAAMVILATALVFSVTFSTPLRGIFSTRLSGFLGRISFPFYLIHLFVICSWSAALFVWLPQAGISILPAMAINIATTLAISVGVSVALLPMERFSVRYAKRIAAVVLGRAKLSTLLNIGLPRSDFVERRSI
ncbi:acyltransferase [Agrobacterium salinitolerans]|nr:acyltransferase [Agrobacterium salinitolerans]